MKFGIIQKVVFILIFILPFYTFSQTKSKKHKHDKPHCVLTYEQVDLIIRITYQTDGQYFSDSEIIRINKILKKIKFTEEWVKIKRKGDYYAKLTKPEKLVYEYEAQKKIKDKIDSCAFLKKDERNTCIKNVRKQIKDKKNENIDSLLFSRKEKQIYKKIVRRENRVRYELNKLMKKKRIPGNKTAHKQYKKNLKKANEFNNRRTRRRR